jgi:hypothetical protein
MSLRGDFSPAFSYRQQAQRQGFLRSTSNVFTSEAQAPKKPNPFLEPGDLGYQGNDDTMHSFIKEMRDVIGKSNSDAAISAADFQKYESILTNARELLEDTIAFSERAQSGTELFKAQKRDLDQRLDLVNSFKKLIQDGKSWLMDGNDNKGKAELEPA